MKKEKRFEKVVEWDENTKNFSIASILFIPLLLWLPIAYTTKNWDFILSVLITYGIIYGIIILGFLSTRKVYFRETKAKKE